MKKMILVLLPLLFIVSVMGCSKGGSGSITVAKTSFTANETFNVDYTVDDKAVSAWVAVFKSGATVAPEEAWSGEYFSWAYTEPKKGTVELTAPDAAGKYDLRLYSGGSEDDKLLETIEIEVK